jgi:CYTH domain-containing protein
MSTELLGESPETDVAPSHAQMIEQLLHDALHRPAPEGVRIVALWWIEHVRTSRESHSDAYLALQGLRCTLRENRELLSDAPLKGAIRHLQVLDGALKKECTLATERAWLESEADMLLPDAAAEAHELGALLTQQHQKAARRAASALQRQFDAFDAVAGRALSHFSVHGTVGVPLNLDAFSAHLAGRLDRSLTRIKRAMHDVEDITSKRELKRIAQGFVRVRAMLQPFITAVPAVGTLYHAVSHGQQQLEAMRTASKLARRARGEKLGGLAAMLDDVSLSHYNAFASEWLADKGERSLAGAYAARAALQLSMDITQFSNASITTEFGVPMEIERKYLLSGCPPEAAVVAGTRIEQGWLPGRTLRERLRRSTYPTGVARYTRTVKFGRGISRVELEEDTDRTLFEALWPLTVSARVRKRRHAIRDGGFTWEIDVFTDRELVLAEVELRSADEHPCLPAWLERWVVRDVTHEPEFINANLAMADEDAPVPAENE